MNIDFTNIHLHTIPLAQFPLHWRFTDGKYGSMPEQHRELIRPLERAAAKFLSGYIAATGLHHNVPFKHGLFRTIDRTKIGLGNQAGIRKWLYRRGLPFDKPVFLSWSDDEAMIVPWKMVVKYFDYFYYSVSDDLTVIDGTLTWALLFYHEDEIYFGTNTDFRPDESDAAMSFSW